jgi:hypothetical protein
MNHEEIATKIADRFFIDDERMPVTRKHLIDAIAAALRRAANEAASAILDDLDKCWSFDNDQQHTHTWHTKQGFMHKHRSKVGTP